MRHVMNPEGLFTGKSDFALSFSSFKKEKRIVLTKRRWLNAKLTSEMRHVMNPEGLFTGKPDFALNMPSLKKGKRIVLTKRL
jgi:hypothetical protein